MISVDGFRNVNCVNLELHKITALVAPCNYGKSNVIEGIGFGWRFLHASPQERARMMAEENDIPQDRESCDRNFRFEIRGKVTFHEQEYTLRYGFTVVWHRPAGPQAHIIEEHLTLKTGLRQKQQVIMEKMATGAHCKRNLTDDDDIGIDAAPGELLFDRLQNRDSWDYAILLKEIDSIAFWIRADDISRHPKIHVLLGNIHDNKDPRPGLLWNMKQRYPDRFTQLREAFLDLLPEVQDLAVQPDVNGNCVLTVRKWEMENRISMSMLSDGARRVFMMLLRLVLADLAGISLLFIGEPDRFFYPGQMPRLLQTIEQMQGSCRVLLTSTSPYFISLLDPTWINMCYAIGVPGDMRIWPITPAQGRTMQLKAKDAGVSFGEYLLADLSKKDAVVKDNLRRYRRNREKKESAAPRDHE